MDVSILEEHFYRRVLYRLRSAVDQTDLVCLEPGMFRFRGWRDLQQNLDDARMALKLWESLKP